MADSPRRGLASPGPLRGLIPRVRPHSSKLALALLCLLASAAIALAFPQVVRHLLDAAFIKGNGSLLNRIALGLLGLFAIQGMLNFVQVYLLTATAERVIAQIREDLFAHLVHLSPGFFTDRRTGELTSRLSNDTTVLQAVLSYNLSEFARQTLFLIGGIVLLTLTHPRLTATTLAVVPIVVGAAFVFGRALRRASTGVQDRIAEATGTAEEAFAQIRTVQSFNGEAEETRRYRSHLSSVVTAAIKRAQIRATFFGILTFCGFGGVVAVLWQGGRLVLEGALTAGALVSFLLYALYVAGAVGSLASLFGAYQEAVGAAKRVFDLLETKPTVSDAPNPRTLPLPSRGEVAFESVSFRYGEELPEALHDVSLRIAHGEVVALVGPSGAGKTTIASLLPRFWDVSSGRITFDGIDVRQLALADLRQAIGIVPQEPALFSGTIRENIAYAGITADGSRPSEESIRAAAAAAHAEEFISRLPQGYDTPVGERGIKLSGGQRQRLAIARVFLKNPALVLLDEATSSLDNESERLIEEAMAELLRGRSTLIIAHRLGTVLRADRLVVIDHGRIVEEGTHSTLVAEDGVYARLYRGQFRTTAAD
ncbi:MAG: ABC transporter transmembrane domain-containing protein [Gemmatimonadota bacterium]|nr:ABC transporter transmembrane domain-containing protein [Gemmatimonadota bacterium]